MFLQSANFLSNLALFLPTPHWVIGNQSTITITLLLCVVCRRLCSYTNNTAVMQMTRFPAAVLLLLIMVMMRQVQGQGKLIDSVCTALCVGTYTNTARQIVSFPACIAFLCILLLHYCLLCSLLIVSLRAIITIQS